MTKYSVWSRRLLLMLLISVVGLADSISAQDEAAIPLPLNETVTGALDGPGGRITYTFEIPVGQDMVIAYEGDKVIFDDYCITLTTPSSQEVQCTEEGGGGGGDHPTVRAHLIPANGQPDVQRTLELTLIRPLEGAVNYAVTAYAITPQVAQPGIPVVVEADPSQPYQVYALDIDLLHPFTVQMEGSNHDGDFLQVANRPYLWEQMFRINSLEEGQLSVQFVDSARHDNNSDGGSEIGLGYSGGTSFRVWVKTIEDYTLRFTPTLASPLLLNETVTGTLGSTSARDTYTFELPVGQEVVIAYEADNIIIDDYCITLGTPPFPAIQVQCRSRAIGGNDSASSNSFVIAAHGQTDAQRAVLSLSHPGTTESAVNYTLTTYTVTPRLIAPGERVTVEADPSQPYQVYALDMNLLQPFTVQIEDAAVDGDFLWVANEPYRPEQIDPFRSVEAGRLVPQFIDSAQRGDNPAGISGIRLDYYSGTRFRVLVKASGNYTAQMMPVVAQTLEENRQRQVSVSYQMPLQLTTLNADAGDLAEITFSMVNGPGALVHVYEIGSREGMHSALGDADLTETLFPLSDTVSWRARGSGELLAVVQIPQEFSRSEVTVAVEWTR